ncbi:MAG: hypothetical protein AUI36_34015 [Cyanobacteria bacterium 13_1_40CM_2_61_4]|nr:MAG: hypothetical protein AUI36_34015 [Cyanobacteria bacterium 13_1_40CM_2_61_4]
MVPALTNSIGDADNRVRRNVVFALLNFGLEAKSSVPALLHAIEDPDQQVRLAAIFALKTIDPEGATKAGFK